MFSYKIDTNIMGQKVATSELTEMTFFSSNTQNWTDTAENLF